MIQLSKGEYMFEKLLGLILLGIILAVSLEFARVMPMTGYVVRDAVQDLQ